MQRSIDFTSDRARYRQLADILRGRIVAGEWEPGRNLPSEADLGHEYETSLATVRRALAVLRIEGHVESVRGMPWRVRERGEAIVVKLKAGDRIRARSASKDDQERYGYLEGTLLLVVSHEGDPDRVFPADEVEGEVPGEE
ncbi:winged helix-turn-helix domain-containing protein [Actinomadura decatromicini]|uniref:Winged helix-turn-helix transcriptional regulator n=1 Tax=Actinomadura decatromicini TaxID=2604572 RepID=A0A5D3FCS8_9ACTN|nr:winged helix-turn-helix domain-containing protein [Actinomadura decatromicini]TYK45135.1 winged helix-turn-helix transcriptional regulator [Actinomadura decatromicini]